MTNQKLVASSYAPDDVTILLQDVRGRVPILDTAEREKLNQSGVHYSEMLPLEYVPSTEYLKIYYDILHSQGEQTAQATINLAEKLVERKGLENITLVSLARAGTPIGILLKRYLEQTYKIIIPHYTISIIRGKGIDKAAMKTILEQHSAKSIVFVDGWIGKGAINRVLKEAVKELNVPDLSPELAVLSDPASETTLYGTTEDFLIPSSCLNSTISGLISRTVHLKTMTDDELHGAIYYQENEDSDLSLEFLTEIESYFSKLQPQTTTAPVNTDMKGLDEVHKIAKEFHVKDINKIKPSLGETIRVLLRRVSDVILIRLDANPNIIAPILQLAKEKNIPIQEYPLQKYNACGIIKDVADL